MAIPNCISSTTRYITLSLVFSTLLAASHALKLQDSSSARSSRTLDLIAAPSIAVSNYKTQSVAPRSSPSSGNRRYGYPYLRAPTLSPYIEARSDDYENEAIRSPSALTVSPAKAFGSRLRSSPEESVSLKKGSPKKQKLAYTYGATRREGRDDEESSAEKRLASYREPKYRNLDDLETMFMPRRMDVDLPYSAYQFSPKAARHPVVSPRDPYLSPSDGPTDSFYPVPKAKSYSSTYSQRDREVPAYGAGRYEDPDVYHHDHIHGSYLGDGYGDSPSKYPESGGHYNYQDDYTIASNQPIVGDIRKKLLDYAGAADLYEGEPDYLKEVSRNKHKYGNIGNDYYAYGGPEYRNSYRDFPYVESKVTLVKKSRT